MERLQRQGWFRDLDRRFDLTERSSSLGADLPGQAWSVGRSLLGAFVDALTVVVLLVFFAANLPRLRQMLGSLFHARQREKVESITGQIVTRVGGYVTATSSCAGWPA